MPKPSNFSKFFSTYLVQPVPDNHKGEIRLDCPFDGCPNPSNHFYANCSDGTWHCKRCDKSGNTRTLITEIHHQAFVSMSPKAYLFLSELRGVGDKTFQRAKWAYDEKNDRWLVPYFTYDPDKNEYSKFLNNLGYFYPSSTNEDTRFKIKKAGGMALYLYNPGIHPCKSLDTLILCEGEWDTLAYLDADPDSNAIVLGKPGSGFNQSYLKPLKSVKTVITMLDNDTSGLQQTAQCQEILKQVTKDIRTLNWTLMEHPAKDIRALWIDISSKLGGTDARVARSKFRSIIIQHTSESEIVSPTPESKVLYQTNLDDYRPVSNFKEYVRTIGQFLYTTPDTIAAMAAVFGITNSITIPGEPLWTFLIGPPSSGKTTFIDSFGGNNKLFDNLSKISAKSLVSGWKDDTGEEPSYLAKLRDKTLFVKDFTVTLTDSLESQKEVFGLLTDIFDGYVKIPYGNNQVREFYDLYFNMVAGVTDIVHSHSAASIGERFLRIDFLGRSYDTREFARRALMNFGQAKVQKDHLIKATLGFVNRLRELPIRMEIQPEYIDPIIDLAEFIATIRTKVESDSKEGIKYRPRTELPARLAATLAKLFVSTRCVYTTDPNSEEDFDISSKLAFETVKKVALDTCYGFSLDIVRAIHQNPHINRMSIASRANIHSQRAYRVLTDLCTTGVLNADSGHVGASGGRPADYFTVNPKIAKVLDYELLPPDVLIGNVNAKTTSYPKRPGPKRPPRLT